MLGQSRLNSTSKAVNVPLVADSEIRSSNKIEILSLAASILLQLKFWCCHSKYNPLLLRDGNRTRETKSN